MDLESRYLELVEKEQIKDLLHLFCLAADRSDFKLLASVFHPEAEIDFGMQKGGVEEFITFAREFLLKYRATHHSLSNSYLKISGDTACGVTYVTAVHEQAKSGAPSLLGWAHYTDRFVKLNGAWKIIRRQWAFDVLVEIPQIGEWPYANMTLGRRDRSDLAYQVIPTL